MKILIAPDSFKGSLSSERICEIGKAALKKALLKANIVTLPMADGGEGTVDSLVINTGGRYIEKIVTGPYDDKVKARYGILGDEETGVIEMSSASGLSLVDSKLLNPLNATSYGTGELILDAIDKGCRKLIIGIGGSATNDGGLGMLKALSFNFLDKEGNPLRGYGKDLINIYEINENNVNKKVKDTEFLVACDVDNPLTGPRGATAVYGPQKGANQEIIKDLEKGMINFGNLAETFYNKKIIEIPGAGAAGGMGAALYGFLDAELKSGFEIIKEAINLEKIIKENKFDLIFTGEGKMDSQTLMGKLVYGMAKLGKKYNIPVIAVCGALEKGWEDMYSHGLTAAFSITNGPMTLDDATENAEELVYESYYNIGKILEL